MKKSLAACALVVLLNNACSSAPAKPDAALEEITVKVTAAAEKPAHAGQTFVLEPEDAGQDRQETQYRRTVRMAVRALELAGFRAATDPKLAEVRVLLAYAISEPSIPGPEGVAKRYFRSVRLQAQRNASKSQAVLWQLRAESIGPAADYATVFPVMLAAAVPYLGQEVPKQVEEKAPATSEAAVKIAAAAGN